MERGLEDCHVGCNLEDATFLHSFYFFVDRSRRNFTLLRDPNSHFLFYDVLLLSNNPLRSVTRFEQNQLHRLKP